MTGEKRLVTPPPWQIKKMIDNVERRSSLPVTGSPSGGGGDGNSSPMLGLKSHGAVASLPGSQKAAPAPVSASIVVPKDISVAAETNSDPLAPFTKSEKDLAKSLHPLGLPTQGMIRLPHNHKKNDSDPVLDSVEPKKREGHLGGGSDAAVQTPIRRVVSRSADHWAEAAAAAKVV
jgi:hypothetical protein